jgi:hypothetical protein
MRLNEDSEKDGATKETRKQRQSILKDRRASAAFLETNRPIPLD